MDIADGILPRVVPARDGTAEPQEVATYEEERRLFYVGMTRAKKALSIFRFRKPELHSSFAQAIFPDKPPIPKRAVNTKLASKAVWTPAVSQEITWIAKDYITGVRVSHKSFGSGRLIDKKGDVVTVHFDDGTEKLFSLTTALQMKQLSLI